MLGERIANNPDGDLNIFEQVRALACYDALEMGGAVYDGASSGNVANTAATATLVATAGYRNFVTGFEITGAGATAAANVVATLTGLLGGTRSYIVVAPAGANAPIQPIMVEFNKPLPASAVNTAISISLPALGAGNTHACVNIHGYRVKET